MLSAGVAFRQQFWPISVSVKRLSERLGVIHPTSGFPGDRIGGLIGGLGARRAAHDPRGACPRVLTRGSAISHRSDLAIDKGRSDGRCGLEQKAPHRHYLYLSSSPLEDEPPEDQDGVVPAEGLGEAQLGAAGAGAGAGAGAAMGAGLGGVGLGAAGFGAAGLAAGAAFFAAAFLAAFLADFGLAAFDFLADFFADFLAFFADFFADFFEDFLPDFFFAIIS